MMRYLINPIHFINKAGCVQFNCDVNNCDYCIHICRLYSCSTKSCSSHCWSQLCSNKKDPYGLEGINK